MEQKRKKSPSVIKKSLKTD